MATIPFNTPQLGTEFFDLCYDDSSVARASTPQLPEGACNYVDLTPGASASKCGCRRFWARQNLGSPTSHQSGWCMCNHHACYHDQGTQGTETRQVLVAPGAGLDNERQMDRPQTGRDPLSPMRAISKADFTSFGGATQLSFLQHTYEGGITDLADASPQQPGTSMPDTLAWADLLQSPADANPALPPIPPQCLMPSQATSATSSVQARYIRPFAGKGLHTLNAAISTKAAVPAPASVPAPQPEAPGAHESFVLVTPDSETPARPGTATTEVEPRVSAEHFPREELRVVTDVVNSHAQRLDKLETASFSVSNHDECVDRHDQMDLRVSELESRLDEVEKMALGGETASNRGADRQDDDATVSTGSAMSNATSRPSHSQGMYSQLQSLQAQVSQLQSIIPSFHHAWEVEVVFLPFPLKRLWQQIHQFKDAAMGNGDDWTQLPMTHSASRARSQSPSQPHFSREWISQDNEVEWLLPRACGDKSLTDKRLRSRGLIRKVAISGPDARSVQSAMHNAFGNVFRDMQMHARPHGASSRLSKFMGLQSPWVPLRKIHKDSRLRFLSPEEMLTPTLWSVQFLSSVMMRAAEPRLFVTHPDAYLQDPQAYESGWTWQKLREAAPACPDMTESQEVPEAEETEVCWAWNEQLDRVPEAPSRRQERRRVSISPSVSHLPPVPSWRSTSPLVAREQTPTLPSRKDLRPPYARMSSVPLSASAPGASSSSNAKRRVVSGGQSRRMTPMAQVASQAGIMKRRRTRSPSHARFTPRWTASPSPMPTGLYERHTTPFMYATPYSNAPLQEMRPVRGSSVLRGKPDEDYEMHVYESGTDESFSDEEEQDAQVVTHAAHSRSPQLPEDEPWPGIEGRSDENVDPEMEEGSEASSQPSEYPSTQSAWPGENAGAGFHIHEDEDD